MALNTWSVEYLEFRRELLGRESGLKYQNTENNEGYMGGYQFGEALLHDVKINGIR